MEKLELRKNLEKKKAYLVCIVLFLVLITPSLINYTISRGITLQNQISIVVTLLLFIGLIYKKMYNIKSKLKKLYK